MYNVFMPLGIIVGFTARVDTIVDGSEEGGDPMLPSMVKVPPWHPATSMFRGDKPSSTDPARLPNLVLFIYHQLPIYAPSI